MTMKRFAAPIGVSLLAVLAMALTPYLLDATCQGLSCFGVLFVYDGIIAAVCAVLALWAFYAAARRLVAAIAAALSSLVQIFAVFYLTIMYMDSGWRLNGMIVVAGMLIFGSVQWGVVAVRRGGVLYWSYLAAPFLLVAAYFVRLSMIRA